MSYELLDFFYVDYVGDIDRKEWSLIGYGFPLAGSAISLKGILKNFIALSTKKVEYMTVSKTTKDGIWLLEVQTILLYHSQSAIFQAQAKCSIRTKHISIRYHFILS